MPPSSRAGPGQFCCTEIGLIVEDTLTEVSVCAYGGAALGESKPAPFPQEHLRFMGGGVGGLGMTIWQGAPGGVILVNSDPLASFFLCLVSDCQRWPLSSLIFATNCVARYRPEMNQIKMLFPGARDKAGEGSA